MPARSIRAAGASAARKYRWRAIAGAAAVLVVCVGLALAMLRGDSSPDSKVSSLADGARFVFVPNRSTAEVAVIDGKFDRVVAAIKVAAVPSQVLVSEAVGAIAVSFAGRRTLEVVNLPPASGRANIDGEVFLSGAEGHIRIRGQVFGLYYGTESSSRLW